MNAVLVNGVALICVFSALYFGGTSLMGAAYLQVGCAVLGVLFFSRTITEGYRAKHPFAVSLSWGGAGGVMLAGLTLLTVCSLAWSISTQATLEQSCQMLSYLTVFLIVVNVFTVDDVRWFSSVVCVAATIVAIVGLYQYWTHTYALFGYTKYVYRERLTGTFVNPNHCGLFLSMSVPFFVCRVLTRPAFGRVIAALGLVLVAAALAGTCSFTAYAACVTGLTFSVLARRSAALGDKRSFLPLLVAVAVVAGCMIALLAGLAHFNTAKYYSVWQRCGLYQGALALITNTVTSGDWLRMFLGYGAGSFAAVFHGFYVHPDVVVFEHAHNEVLEYCSDLGFVGGAGIVVFAVAVFAKCVRGFMDRRGSDDQRLGIAITAAVIMVCVQSCFDFAVRVSAIGLLFCVFAASGVVLLRPRPAECARFSKRSGVYGWAVMIAGAVAAVLACLQLAAGNMIVQAQTAANAGDDVAADDYCRMAVALSPRDAKVYEYYSDFLSTRAYADPGAQAAGLLHARDMLRQARALSPQEPRYLIEAGWLEYLRGDRVRARAYFDEAIALNDKLLLSWLERAKFCLYNANFKSAAEDYVRIFDAIARIPDSSESRTVFIVQEIHKDLLEYPLQKELQPVYDQIAAYRKKHGHR